MENAGHSSPFELDGPHSSRRAFIRFVAASPLLAFLGCADGGGADRYELDQPMASPDGPIQGHDNDAVRVIASPEEAVNVFDFDLVAQQVLPPAHYGYIATGVDDDHTLNANREGFRRFRLMPRRLVDVSQIDMSVTLLGERWDTPIVLAPVGSQRALHHEGELAAARASNALGHHQILSTVSTTSVEDINAIRDRPVWFQLYPTSSWDVTQVLIRRAEEAGCGALVLTVDLPVGSNREALERYVGRDARDCSQCHEAAPPSDDPMSFPTGWLARKPMFDGLDMTRVSFDTPSLTWDFIRRLRDATGMRLIVKGIMRDDDALRAVGNGVDGIIVSNHGGRADESGHSTIEALPAIVDSVRGRVPVLVDGGFRRGTDILKALALGANAICIGRPYLWGLAAFGQDGVERVLRILRAELRLAMQLNGIPRIASVDRTWVTR